MNSNLISISDPDGTSGALEVYISVTNGALTLSGTAGITIGSGSNGSSAMRISGTLSAINTALDGMSYTPTSDYNGSAALTITTTDMETSLLTLNSTLLKKYVSNTKKT